MSSAIGQDQTAFWNGPAGEHWAKEQELFDPGLRPLAAPAMEALDLRGGEAVLDVGCGCGDTSLSLADRVGPEGRVLGLDISDPMLARARQRAMDRVNVSFALGDASIFPFEPASFDVLFSRFGVMFFPEPAAAFSHMANALKPGARVAFVCWRPLEENPWAKVPFDAVVSVVGALPPMPPDAPGPFSLRDPVRVRAILEGAGLVDVALARLDMVQTMGATRSGVAPTLDEAVDFAIKIGPAARVLREVQDDALRSRAVAALRDALAKHVMPDRVRLAAACWTVTAKKPR